MKFLKIIGFSLLVLTAILLLYTVTSLVLSLITIKQETNTKPEVSIYILTNNIHTDIVVPIKSESLDWAKDTILIDSVTQNFAFNYIGFGWGNKDFYLNTPEWSDLKLSTAIKATLGFGKSAMHVTFFKNMQENEYCKRIEISREQYLRLSSYIQNSFRKGYNGEIIPIPTNDIYSNFNLFYEAIGHYSMIYTCNSWTNTCLRNSGQKACLWTPFSFGIFYQYK